MNLAIYLGLVGSVFLAVVILFLKESFRSQKADAGNQPFIQDPRIPSLLDRLGANEQVKSTETAPFQASRVSPSIDSFPSPTQPTPMRTPTPEVNPSLETSPHTADPSLNINAEYVELETKFEDLQLKHQKLETLFREKSESLEKSEKALANEIKNRKDFNKVKDILEKEIRDLKDSHHKTDLELTAAKAETENFKKRCGQLEEKVKGLETSLKGKDKEIDDLMKRLVTFASPQTTSAAVDSSSMNQSTSAAPPTPLTSESHQLSEVPAAEPPKENLQSPTPNVPVERPLEIASAEHSEDPTPQNKDDNQSPKSAPS